MSGLDRHRLYIPVRDASRIPDACKTLFTLLWAFGQGSYKVGRAGQALERSLIEPRGGTHKCPYGDHLSTEGSGGTK